MKLSNTLYILLGAGLILSPGCKKFAEVPPASNIMNKDYVFSSDGSVSNAIAGMYMNAYLQTLNVFQDYITICPGLSADELNIVGINTSYEPFLRNQLDANTPAVNECWTGFYKSIYLANTLIEGVSANENVLKPETVAMAKGEGLFMRAFCHFYMVNLFGDVPLVLTSDAYTNNALSRTPQAKVYDQIIADLKAAKELLHGDYSVSAGNQRFRANKFAAAALLARAYLYTGQWSLAETEASTVIGATDLYKLMPSEDIAKIFYKNSPEAIWQMNGSTGSSSTFNGYNDIAYAFLGTYMPTLVMSAELEASFPQGDLRLANWTQMMTISGQSYRVPAKYRNQTVTAGATGEGYMYLRLTEQFLIRAEARAQLGTDLTAAKADLDTVRTRAGLQKTDATGKPGLLLAIEKERQLELFTETGHRWFDLRRTHRADAVLGSKQGWEDFKVRYPIPAVELLNNSNLKQNTGYVK